MLSESNDSSDNSYDEAWPRSTSTHSEINDNGIQLTSIHSEVESDTNEPIARDEDTDEETSSEIKKDKIIILYRRRWIVLFLFSILTYSNAASWITFSPIAEIVKEEYGINDFWVNSLGTIFMVIYIPVVFPAIYCLNEKGLRFGVLVGALSNAIGGWIRTLGASIGSFPIIFIGQSFHGVAQAFILGVPSYLSSIWFGSEERSKATGFAVVANQLGLAMGFIISPLLVREGSDLKHFLFWEAVFFTCICVAIFAGFKNAPPTPPSKAASSSLNNAIDNTSIGEMKILSTDKSFILLLISYGIAVGEFYAISVLINELLESRFPGHYSDFGWIGFSIIIAGVLGTFIVGYLLDATKLYREITCCIYCLSLLSTIFFFVSVLYLPLNAVYISAAVLGLTLTSLIPTGFEFAAEITYPIAESTSSGLLNCVAQIFGIILTVGSGWGIDNVTEKSACIVLVTFIFIGAVLSFFVKGETLRHFADSIEEHKHEDCDGVIIEQNSSDEEYFDGMSDSVQLLASYD